jgi:acid phosphatase (class A)
MPRLEISLLILALLGGGASSLEVLFKLRNQPPHCESNVGSPPVLKELKRGLLEGYLAQEARPDSLKLLDPPPSPGSAAFALDEAVAQATFAGQGGARWQLAARDADLHFPAAAGIFACASGIRISEEDTPRLYTLLRRTLTDAGLATYKAKEHYQRLRPFLKNEQPICSPDDEVELTTDWSYPSGHTSVGWAWALILSEIVPNRQDQILQRGREYGKSRNVCNVHWHSDVQAGLLMGSATVAQLQANPVFRADLRAAAAEVKAQQALNPNANGIDCELEQQALRP